MTSLALTTASELGSRSSLSRRRFSTNNLGSIGWCRISGEFTAGVEAFPIRLEPGKPSAPEAAGVLLTASSDIGRNRGRFEHSSLASERLEVSCGYRFAYKRGGSAPEPLLR